MCNTQVATSVGRFERLAIRDVWPHEAHSFTRWLFNNLDVLGDALGETLTGVRTEAPTGNFNVDILARDHLGRTVVVENQFGRSDHDHLGKLLTYTANFEAAAAVWVVEKASSEHKLAVHWLNESSAGTRFYLLQIEVLRIGDSEPAPRLTVLSEPSDAIRVVGDQKRALNDQENEQSLFWKALLTVVEARQSLHAGLRPRLGQYLPVSSGVPGASYTYCVFKDWIRIELYISRGSEEASNELFDTLFAHKQEVESRVGGAIVWERLNGRKSCRIKIDLVDGGLDNASDWERIIQNAVVAMDRLVDATRPVLLEAFDRGLS